MDRERIPFDSQPAVVQTLIVGLLGLFFLICLAIVVTLWKLVLAI